MEIRKNSVRDSPKPQTIEASHQLIKELFENLINDIENVDNAKDAVNRNTAAGKKLRDSVMEIEKMVKVVKTIASQTNMLALNASIEAAGAGEAGKGFAVVANEVKELAKQTAKATAMISAKVAEIQKNVDNATHSVQEITHLIEEIGSSNHAILDTMSQKQRHP
ncbi:MAG: hypothetical protein HQL72_09735 [Magnetococcales bacterium]|nr:hypothetical protein [Magnetococcales bacterium]